MDSPDLHEVLFQWPHTEPYNVIVTGTFDQWSRSILLSKTPTGFEATIKIPYGDKIKYKFIVDGQWVFRDDLPTDVDPGGFINNVYTAPHKSISSPLSLPPAAVLQSPFNTPQDASVAGHHTSPKPLDPLNPMQPVTTTSEANADSTSSSGTADTTENSNHKMENGVIINIATTIAAADGTSSAFSYVASGIGAAVHGVIGVDPVNPEQIAIPTPIAAKAFDGPSTQPETPAPEAKQELLETSDSIPISHPEESLSRAEDIPSPVASGVPTTIVPVNAPEHDTEPTYPSSPTTRGAVPVANPSVAEPNLDAPVTPEEPSAHTAVMPAADVSVADPIVDKSVIKKGTSSPPEIIVNSPENFIDLDPSLPTREAVSVAPGAPQPKVEMLVTPEKLSTHIDIVPAVGVVGSSTVGSVAEPIVDKPVIERMTAPEVKEKEKEKEHDTAEVATNGSAKAEAAQPPEAETSVSVPPPVSSIAISEPSANAGATDASAPIPNKPVVVDPPTTPANKPSTNGASSPPPTPSSTKKDTTGSTPSTPTKKFFPRSNSPSPSASSSKFGTTSSTRKKRQSIFGKVKNLFHHDKEKSGDKK